MIGKLYYSYRKSTLLRSILWTILIVGVYMLGQRVLLSTVPLSHQEIKLAVDQHLLNNFSAVSGGSFNKLNVFTLGLSPWMSSMIIWRFVSLFSWAKNATKRKAEVAQYTLMLTISVIQAYGVSGNQFIKSSLLGSYSDIVFKALTMVLLISGSFVLMWLANLNASKGLGGSIVIILVSMLQATTTGIITYFEQSHFSIMDLLGTIIAISIILSVLLLISTVVYRAEYRIPIRRIDIVSKFAQDTYIPIRINPAGSHPFMYGMTLMMLPTFIIQALLLAFPNERLLIQISSMIAINKPLGIGLFVILLFILSIGFAYFNYDPYNIAKNMRQRGEYFQNVTPGAATQRFLQEKISIMAVVGAIFTVIMGGLPMLAVVGKTNQVSIAMIVINIYIISTFMLSIIEQVNTLKLWGSHRNII
ncbi:accessory Sec system protein translocase subunit SecY2 [Streptococcus agalactiae]|uniref:accessory Sec system protein translocase subunit SecY2 n=1 Tax=Streptococcus agalactiae TaxID=1311 RepID=UPI0013FCFB63|nr:accessory Sec system protein translocase subunit SecY2 [Streptococcus agalactiae]HEN2232465.1 accessory Sec system protein translocase subunit SecY2 [Streptococcus agalactiae]HEN6622401.1 accessory Sec system protein translocase subunit SecY2 [Streptococcus agalactiae]